MLPFTNQIQLVGRAGHDPEGLLLSDGTHRSTLRLYQNNRTIGKRQEPQVHHLVAWSGVARRLQASVRRGNRILVQGKLLYRKFECRGMTHVRPEIHVDHFAVLDVRVDTEMAAVADEPQAYGHHE